MLLEIKPSGHLKDLCMTIFIVLNNLKFNPLIGNDQLTRD